MLTQIGPHTVEVQGDCTLVRLRGSFTLEHMKEFCRLADAVIAEQGHLFTISDFSAGGDFPADSRRLGSEWPGNVHILGTAVFGASLAASVIVSMMARVTKLIKKHAIPTAAFKTESEALYWVSELRQKLVPQRPGRASV